MMIKAPTVNADTIIFSYGQPKDAATFVKSNKALSRYVGVNFQVGGPMESRNVISITDPYLKLAVDPNDTPENVSFLKW